MFVNTLVIIDIETGETLEKRGFTYHGPVESLCGPSSGVKTATGQIASTSAAQTAAYQQAIQQAQTVFGAGSNIFNQLTSAFSPILSAGPGQSGYTQGELQNLQSSAITQTGQQYRNAAQAAGERTAARGGGTAFLPSGVDAAVQGNIASQGAAQTANQLSQINTNNATLGRENWLAAAGQLAGAPNVFNPANNALGASTSAGQAAISGGQANLTAQNQLQTQQNWWQPLVGQTLGGIASVLTGGLSGGVTGALGSFGGGSIGGAADAALGTPQYMNPATASGIPIPPQGSGGYGTVPGT